VSPRTVTIYTRANCKLCAEAERVVDAVAGGRATIVRVDVDAHPELTDRYTVRVPVVAVDGVELFEYQVEPGALRAALEVATPR
jgi:glutaredoxin